MSITWKQIKNNSKTTLSVILAQLATSMTVTDATALPTTFPFYATIWDKLTYSDPGDDPSMEIVLVTSLVGGNVLNITRGQDGTSDVAHGSGNWVANLINKETLAQIEDEIDKTDYAQVVNVDPTNGDYQTIKAAVASISDNSATKPYVIKVHPGIYTEDNPIVMKPFVSIIGEQQRAVVVKPSNNSAAVFSLAIVAEIRDLAIDASAATGITAIEATDITITRARITNVSFNTCTTGILINVADAKCYATFINAMGTFTDVISVLDGEFQVTDLIIDSTITTTNVVKVDGATAKAHIVSAVIDDLTATNGILVDNSGEVHLFNSEISSADITNAIHVDDYGEINIYSSSISLVTNALRVGSTNYGTIKAIGLDIKDTITYDLLVENTTGYFNGYNVSMIRDKISLIGDTQSQYFGFDVDADAYRFLDDVFIGQDGSGHGAKIGEGGNYNTAVKVFSYNGAAYADVTASGTIAFPNINLNSALYFGDTDSYKFHSLTYLMGATAINLGAGSITWEYYDGGVAGWVAFKTLNTRSGYSNSQSDSSFTGTNSKDYDVRFDQNMKTGVKESNASATGWTANAVNGTTAYWVRCRISSAITTSPIFSTVYLGGNYISFRSNGTQSYHGEARPELIQSAIFGDNNSSAADSALSISTNINYAYSQNTLANNANDQLYWRIPILNRFDTSSGITVQFELCTNVTPGTSTYTAKLHFYAALFKANGIFNGTATQTHQAFNFVATAGTAAYRSQKITMTYRVDISTLVPGDTLYCQLSRLSNEAGDDLPGNVILSNVLYTSTTWQNGLNNE